MTYTRFRDIPQMTSSGGWQCEYPIQSVIKTLDSWVAEPLGPLDLDPDFQRAHVWTEAQQIAWIEFLLRGGKTGKTIYLNHPGWHSTYQGDFVLVDGKQRVQALRRFLNNEIPAFGSLLREYTDKMNRSEYTLSINVNNLKTRADVLRWYVEMNAGGTPHTAEEISKVVEMLKLEGKHDR